MNDLLQRDHGGDIATEIGLIRSTEGPQIETMGNYQDLPSTLERLGYLQKKNE